ncbi:sodium:proton antiporter NhaD [Chryseosolibacter indicus]|uniref:Sodium:proton antiporter NhaD n=1 Tax=Chryseosolibacter indicus TaxID=2782351 RepID=A0ABS5VV11_9BACT|nr:sodium:proton antiporter NhaD [Chryseosolibacter indicus]MBT1704662.1 sodium:proton antiporter NhaD [Chryseosolibacter indicus]
MEFIIIAVFVIGYVLIALEHSIKINKTATALLTGVLCWTLFVISSPTENLLLSKHFKEFVSLLKDEAGTEKVETYSQSEVFNHFVSHELSHHLGSISEILFFLLGAMTIVELIDAHHGFRFITEKIKTKNPKVLLWIVCWVSFFLSGVLDNLTTTIVMVSLVRKLVTDRERRLLFIGMIIIAANAGGAWTPMGDVTTTMLWIGGQVSTFNIMKGLLLPSMVTLLLPLLYLSLTMKNNSAQVVEERSQKSEVVVGGGKLMLILGIGLMLGVPVFKVITHLPPYIGMMAGLGIMWVVSELIHPKLDEVSRKKYTAAGALSRIDVPSVLFFLGILLAVSALESMLVLQRFSEYLAESIGNQTIIIALIGILSAIVDNVPLVAASMGMYSLETYPTDHFIWEYLAYCAGTGGSILIIGSAAGVAAMGMEKIDFIWYVRKISLLALLGYAGGAGLYVLLHQYL